MSILSAIIIDMNPAATAGTFSFGGVSGLSVGSVGASKGPERVNEVVNAVNSAPSTGDSNMLSYRAADLGGGYLLLATQHAPTKVPDFATKTNVSSLTVGSLPGVWIGASIVDSAYEPNAIKTGIALGLAAAKVAHNA